MNAATLQKANELNKRIKEFTEAQNCFELEDLSGKKISTNPRLIIDFDGVDGREQIFFPLGLSETMVGFLKQEINKARNAAIAEFQAL